MGNFRTTRWSLIAAARNVNKTKARQALAELCELYWYPVYAYIRRSGHSADRAQDLTQEFFAQLLEKRNIAGADRNRGRFRNYLLGAVRHFLANEHDRATAAKRGGGKAMLSLDFPDAERMYEVEPIEERTAEQIFERRWALMLLARTLTEVRDEYAKAGNEALFDRLSGALTGESEGYSTVADDLDMTEAAVKVAAHRLRRRYRDRLRAIIADTVETPDEVDDEIRALFAALGA
jgi:RNA polymerase sigma-70 factor (ECF subfamily)